MIWSYLYMVHISYSRFHEEMKYLKIFCDLLTNVFMIFKQIKLRK